MNHNTRHIGFNHQVSGPHFDKMQAIWIFLSAIQAVYIAIFILYKSSSTTVGDVYGTFVYRYFVRRQRDAWLLFDMFRQTSEYFFVEQFTSLTHKCLGMVDVAHFTSTVVLEDD